MNLFLKRILSQQVLAFTILAFGVDHPVKRVFLFRVDSFGCQGLGDETCADLAAVPLDWAAAGGSAPSRRIV